MTGLTSFGLLMSCLVLMLAVALTWPLWWGHLSRAFSRAVSKPAPEAPIVEMVAMLLHEHPEQWDCGRHHLTHKAIGADIWIANERYGLSLSLSGDASPSSLGSDLQLHEETREVLWQAVQFYRLWQINRTVHDFAEKVKGAMA